LIFFLLLLKEGSSKTKGRPQSGKNNKNFKPTESMNEGNDEQRIFEDFVGMLGKYDPSKKQIYI